MAFSMVVRTCSWLTSSENFCGRYLRAMTWYMRGDMPDPGWSAAHDANPLPLLPSGPGGVCGRALHEVRGLTTIMLAEEDGGACYSDFCLLTSVFCILCSEQSSSTSAEPSFLSTSTAATRPWRARAACRRPRS